jgi:hemin uptake protein HemP
MTEDEPACGAAASPDSTTQRRATRPAPVRTVKSSELLAGNDALLIDHRGSIYCLRQTSSGKLILTK